MATQQKKSAQRHGFKTGEYIVYPAHGVGQISSIDEQEVAGHKLELFVIDFQKDKMRLKVPVAKATSIGMRKLSETDYVDRALKVVQGRARIKRTMWSRRAQEYDAKINSGDLISISEVVRDLYRARELPARVIDFTPAMADIWAVTDLTVSRSGASTCAELTACGVPSVLMPYPFHKDQHQRLNAKVLADAGAAVLLDDLRDAKKNAEALQPVLAPLIHDADRRKTMAAAARNLGKPDAADTVARVIQGLVTSGR